MLQTIRNILFRIVRPHFWFMLYDYDERWDTFILQAIAEGDVHKDNEFTSFVGGFEVWTTNYPYAYGRSEKPSLTLRPSCRTIKLLHDTLEG